MAKIDINTVINGEYEVAVGNEYEVAPGKWGRLKPPTAELQERVMKMAEEEGMTDLKVCREVLAGLPDFSEDNVITGMPTKVVQDFFTLVLRIVKRLTGDSALSEASATLKAES
jgi:hypothetical protein